MLKTISKIGNSLGLIFDEALRELTGLKAGDEVNITVEDDGRVVITPVSKSTDPPEVGKTVRRTLRDYRKTLRKLA